MVSEVAMGAVFLVCCLCIMRQRQPSQECVSLSCLTFLLSLFLWCQKQEPDYNFVLPHWDPLHCPVVALAILLHYVFDQEDLVSKVEGWDWSCASSW